MRTDPLRDFLIGTVVVFLVALIAVGLVTFNGLLSEDQLDKRVSTTLEALKVFATIFGGVAVVINAYYAAKRAEAMDKSAIAAEKNIEIGLKNVEIGLKNAVLTEERLVTERFTKAIEQLGSDKLEIRLGGIYALERISKDSEKDYLQVMEVLTVYVREKSREILEKEEESDFNPPSYLSMDLQLILTVLSRRTAAPETDKPFILNLRDTRLPKLYLPKEANLEGVNFEGADLSKANLAHVELRGLEFGLTNITLQSANLLYSNLQEVKISGTDLTSALLLYANLEKSEISDTDLTSAFLMGANLNESKILRVKMLKAKLPQAQLQGAKIEDAEIQHANLKGVDATGSVLHHVYLENADLENAIFRNSQLKYVKLQKAKLINTDFQGATLSEVDLTEATLTGTDFRDANLERVSGLNQQQLTVIIKNENTKFPAYLQISKQVES